MYCKTIVNHDIWISYQYIIIYHISYIVIYQVPANIPLTTCIPMLPVTWSIYQQAICITDRCILPLIKQNKYRKGHTFLADIHARKHCQPTISVPKLIGNLMVSKFASSQNGCADFSSQIANATDPPKIDMSSEKGPLKKEHSLPTIIFQKLWE